MHRLANKLSQNETTALVELKEVLAQDYGVEYVRLFGSKARGTGHAESDLDLFIVVPLEKQK